MADSKTLFLFAGCNGAGKSTLYLTLSATYDFGIRLNSDELVRASKEDWRDPAAQVRAGRRVLTLQKECLSKGKTFNRETTLTGTTILTTAQKAKELGYEVVLYYVGVASPQIAKDRVKKRIEQGGHGISDDAVERRYDNSIENFTKIFPVCDRVEVYDNTISFKTLCKFASGELIWSDNYEWTLDPQYAWAVTLLDRVTSNKSFSELVKKWSEQNATQIKPMND